MAHNDSCASLGCGVLMLLVAVFFVLPFALRIVIGVCGFLLGIFG